MSKFIEVQNVDSISIVTFIQAFTPSTRNALIEELQEANGQNNVILDCTDIQYIDGTGLSCIIYLNKHLKKTRGKLILCNVPSNVGEVIKVMRIDRVLSIKSTRKEAIKEFQQIESHNQFLSHGDRYDE